MKRLPNAAAGTTAIAIQDCVAASLITAPGRAEVQLIARDGQRLRVETDEATATALAVTMWKALEAA